jgi:hypothetical protein
MRIAFIVYHDVLEDRLIEILDELKIDSFTKWENVTGKFHGAEPHLGTRTFPGYESVRLVPFTEEDTLKKLIEKLESFNQKAVKPADCIRMFLLPLEKVV